MSYANLQQLVQELTIDLNSHKYYHWINEELRRKGKLVVGNDVELRQSILQWLHFSPASGHSGITTTMQRVKYILYWKGMTKDIKTFINHCEICQRSKYETVVSPGLLQPLLIPGQVWQDISMGFIEGLPNSSGKQVIFVVVDRLSKVAYFIALSHPYIAKEVAKVFLDNVFKLHGFPSTITSDRDSVFVSAFWIEFMKFQGVQLQLSSSYHSQTNGQTKVIN